MIFSTLGYGEKEIIKASQVAEVYLKPTSYTLDEVVISKALEPKALKLLAKPKNEIYQAFDNGPKIDTKFFPDLALQKDKIFKASQHLHR